MSQEKEKDPIGYLNRLLGEYYQLQGDNTYYTKQNDNLGIFAKYCVCSIYRIYCYPFDLFIMYND